ncbi:MAG: cupin domain-containing protein [Desulfobacterales bacterium]|nr:cupin domain-containing protein [Desulfobacterales bacterium]
MIRKCSADVAPIETLREGFKGMHARYLWSTDDGPQKFAMRLMEFEPYGHTSYHKHLEEHQFYFLEGEPAYVGADGNEIRLAPGDTIYTASDEEHQIKNAGSTVMKMICMIPILPGGDGKYPAPRPDGKDYVSATKKGAC